MIHDLDLSRLRDPGALPPEAANAEAGFFGRPVLPPGYRYALLWSRLGQGAADARPFVYASGAELARAIHRRRAGAAILLLDCPLSVAPRRCPDTPLHGVSVWTLDPGGAADPWAPDGRKDRYLGWAYADGEGRHGLRSLLRRNLLGG